MTNTGKSTDSYSGGSFDRHLRNPVFLTGPCQFELNAINFLNTIRLLSVSSSRPSSPVPPYETSESVSATFGRRSGNINSSFRPVSFETTALRHECRRDRYVIPASNYCATVIIVRAWFHVVSDRKRETAKVTGSAAAEDISNALWIVFFFAPGNTTVDTEFYENVSIRLCKRMPSRFGKVLKTIFSHPSRLNTGRTMCVCAYTVFTRFSRVRGKGVGNRGETNERKITRKKYQLKLFRTTVPPRA